MKKDYIGGGKQETAIKFYIKQLKKKVLKTLISLLIDSANIFRITQTEALLEKQEAPNEIIATNTHYKVGKTVRKAIKDLGGTMPEDLPTLDKSLKELEKENKNLIIKKQQI